ncbi:hypothetical protein MASR1M60_06130 [Rhodocyclaceae bacterium]
MLKRYRSRGLSMVEIMVALALLVALLLAGLPTFTTMIAGARVRSVAEDLLAGVQLARVEALKRGEPVRFNLDAEVGGGWSAVLVSSDEVLSSRNAVEGATVNVVGDLDNFAVFNSFGLRVQPVGGDLTFSITKPDSGDCQPAGTIRCMAVVVRSGGQVRMCDPLRPAGDPQSCIMEATP